MRGTQPTPAQHAALVARLIGAYAQMIARAHAHGIKVIGTTILPFTGNAGYHPGPLTESDRQSINDWIRATGHFDGVVDFDRVLADPAHPSQLRPDYDSGDHLHPSVAGYHAMADVVPRELLQ
jgi:lysophospholipase L1-like esterase